MGKKARTLCAPVVSARVRRFDAPRRLGTSMMLGLLLALALLPSLAFTLQAQEVVTPLIVTTPTLPVVPVTPAPASTATPASAPGMYSYAASDTGYVVQPGDTLLSVALEVGVDLEDTYCLVAPGFTWAQPLVIGDTLTIPPAGTICHEVTEGDTIESIAAHYEVPAARIFDEPWNQLSEPDTALMPGTHLRVPKSIREDAVVEIEIPVVPEDAALSTGVLPLLLSQPVNADVAPVMAVGAVFSQGEAPAVGSPRTDIMAPMPSDWPYGSGHFNWPVAGWLTQGYLPDHRAIDVAAPVGTVVTAADRGRVIRAGWNDQGYGLFVIVDHNIDYITLYAHLSQVMVEEGDVVAAGQPLGHVGSTGNSTGPHLHFEIRDFGKRIDPLSLLLQ